MGAGASGASADLANKPLEPEDKPRRTKVTATLGPASWSEEMIPVMIKARPRAELVVVCGCDRVERGAAADRPRLRSRRRGED